MASYYGGATLDLQKALIWVVFLKTLFETHALDGKDPINEVWVHCILLFQKPVLRNEACHKVSPSHHSSK